MPPRVPPQGVWAPAVTAFNKEDDTIDFETAKKYYAYLSRSGLAGLVILGTNAETFLLTREERLQLIKTAREAVGPDYPLMAGVGGHSTKQVLEFSQDAYNAGANYLLVLPPAYFGKQTTPAVIKRFYGDLAQKAPLPIVLYNFPAVTNGIDLDSELITSIVNASAAASPDGTSNIVGVKLTCAQVGKITRLAGTFGPDKFSVYCGQSDFLLGGLAVGAAGCIAAFANIFPKTVSHIFKLFKEGKYEEALSLHQRAALAESPTKAGIATTKYAVATYTAPKAGIENAQDKFLPRTPYEPPTEAVQQTVRSAMAEIASVEDKL